MVLRYNVTWFCYISVIIKWRITCWKWSVATDVWGMPVEVWHWVRNSQKGRNSRLLSHDYSTIPLDLLDLKSILLRRCLANLQPFMYDKCDAILKRQERNEIYKWFYKRVSVKFHYSMLLINSGYLCKFTLLWT